MNVAIHGERELLVRMANDISNVYKIQEIDESPFLTMVISNTTMCCYLYPNAGIGTEVKHHLTPSNYNEILNIIIERKDEHKIKSI